MFKDLIHQVVQRDSFQEKKLEVFFSDAGATFLERAEEFTLGLNRYLTNNGRNQKDVVEAYLQLCADMMSEQIKFMRTDLYSMPNQETAFNQIYDNKIKMQAYMEGLALSQFLWESHYKILDFYIDVITSLSNKVSSYLEIGPGHGLYLSYAAKILQESRLTAVDISETSIELTKKMLSALNWDQKNLNIEYHVGNFETFPSRESFDFITMGEVIEHLDNPLPLLRKIRDRLSAKGYAFLTTCANCPAIDHVYLFRSVGEIQKLLDRACFQIIEERVLPVERLPMEEIVSQKICINYAALVQRKN